MILQEVGGDRFALPAVPGHDIHVMKSCTKLANMSIFSHITA
jgi:hypothetical protein